MRAKRHGRQRNVRRDVGTLTPSRCGRFCFSCQRSLTASQNGGDRRHFAGLAAAVIFVAVMVSPFIAPVSFTSSPACEAMVFEL
jgi:hypothetical protein